MEANSSDIDEKIPRQTDEMPAKKLGQPTSSPNSPGMYVLQWLSYAFWGFTVLALAWLTTVSVAHFIDASSVSTADNMVAYSLAAVIVLFIISLICDVFYSRREPQHKTGGAMVIMIIHAVIFALFGIGALILAVFAIVRMIIGDGTYSNDSGPLTMLISAGIIAVVYGATLLRTLNPSWLKHSTRMYWVFITVVVVAITGLAIAGPAAQARSTRDDRVIERSLTQVSEAINRYADEKSALPASLGDIKSSLEGDALSLVERNLVEYKPIEAESTSTTYIPPADITREAFNYDLCVTYKAESAYGGYDYPTKEGEGGREVSPNTYSHDAGRVCYELTTSYSSSIY